MFSLVVVMTIASASKPSRWEDICRFRENVRLRKRRPWELVRCRSRRQRLRGNEGTILREDGKIDYRKVDGVCLQCSLRCAGGRKCWRMNPGGQLQIHQALEVYNHTLSSRVVRVSECMYNVEITKVSHRASPLHGPCLVLGRFVAFPRWPSLDGLPRPEWTAG